MAQDPFRTCREVSTRASSISWQTISEDPLSFAFEFCLPEGRITFQTVTKSWRAPFLKWTCGVELFSCLFCNGEEFLVLALKMRPKEYCQKAAKVGSDLKLMDRKSPLTGWGEKIGKSLDHSDPHLRFCLPPTCTFFIWNMKLRVLNFTTHWKDKQQRSLFHKIYLSFLLLRK